MTITHDEGVRSFQNKPLVAALGFFDGVHLGHQKVIQTAKQIAKEKGMNLAVLTFFPHPQEVLSRGKQKVHYLEPLSSKKEKFAKIGVDILYVIRFDLNFASLLPQQFIKEYIVGLNIQHVVAGFDFTYGYRGEGNMQRMKEDGKGHFDVTIVSKFSKVDQKVSSTLIREKLSSGEVSEIQDYLGEPYETVGQIYSITSKLTKSYINASINMKPFYMLPKPGFYRIQAIMDHDPYNGVCYVPVEENKKAIMSIEKECAMKIAPNKEIRLKWLQRINGLYMSSNVKHLYVM
ncbi:FAD synthetase family protein [Bacillus alveayuensis]|uniref:FAD synthetase family protein n=1 Tax=Aeribacillus alveayuensis TaxID=279215 RepID=UPI000698B8ED|nr:FAD synthetase family protein [Bacillus alveayuensis]